MNNDIIEKKIVIDVQKLQDVYNLSDLIGEIGNMIYEGAGQNTFIYVNIEGLEEFFYDYDFDGEHEYFIPNGNDEENPSLYKVYQLMKSGELPEEFILLIWW